jgi:hypothetical protein
MLYKFKQNNHYQDIFKDGELVGKLFITMHPDIMYSVSNKKGNKCKRVNTEKEAIEFLEGLTKNNETN